jgi:surface protein
MFLNCDAFNGYGVDTWDTSNVVDMKDMFRYTPTFNGDVSSWNVSRVTTMRGMFRQAVAFNSDLSKWDVRSVTDISQMVRTQATYCLPNHNNTTLSPSQNSYLNVFFSLFFSSCMLYGLMLTYQRGIRPH